MCLWNRQQRTENTDGACTKFVAGLFVAYKGSTATRGKILVAIRVNEYSNLEAVVGRC